MAYMQQKSFLNIIIYIEIKMSYMALFNILKLFNKIEIDIEGIRPKVDHKNQLFK